VKYKGREKSKNIIDKRTPRKIRNNNDTVAVPYNDGTFGGKTEKGMFKDREYSKDRIKPKAGKKAKPKNINAKKNKKKLSTKKFTKMDK